MPEASKIRAKANGKKPGRPKVSAAIVREIELAHKGGTGMLSIAKKVGVGSGTVQRVVRELKTREAA